MDPLGGGTDVLSLCWKPVFPKRTGLQSSVSWGLHSDKRALNLARTTLDLHAGRGPSG